MTIAFLCFQGSRLCDRRGRWTVDEQPARRGLRYCSRSKRAPESASVRPSPSTTHDRPSTPARPRRSFAGDGARGMRPCRGRRRSARARYRDVAHAPARPRGSARLFMHWHAASRSSIQSCSTLPHWTAWRMASAWSVADSGAAVLFRSSRARRTAAGRVQVPQFEHAATIDPAAPMKNPESRPADSSSISPTRFTLGASVDPARRAGLVARPRPD